MIEAPGNDDTDTVFPVHLRDSHEHAYLKMREAVEAEKVIYVSGYVLDNGIPRRYKYNKGCIDMTESCIWMPNTRGEGTSVLSPMLGSSLASLFTVFPEYPADDLISLTNSCADRFPQLPGGGVFNAPCMIETICEELDSSSPACAVKQPTDPIVVRTDISTLENPMVKEGILYAEESGISAISGWVCDAEEVTVELNGQSFRTGYGTTRGDTVDDCGDDDNGFSFLFNWNLLGDGIHIVKAYADGVLFASTRVKVTTLGSEFVRGISDGPRHFSNSPTNGYSFSDEYPNRYLRWEESLQNFFITDGVALERSGYRSIPELKALLENPDLGSSQSGISALSGWVCDANEVTVEINGVPYVTGYGTTRGDTVDDCGDDDNGFSFLFNWNLLGDGIHAVKAYADDVLFASTRVKVTTLGSEFVRGKWIHGNLSQVPKEGGLIVSWWESKQNFVITANYSLDPLDH